MAASFSGKCLCGSVRYTCSAEPMMSGHCHCEDCRRSSGSGHSSHLAVPEASVTFVGASKGYDKPADSGNLVSRHFCPNCGAPVFSSNSAMPGLIFLRASSLDNLEVFKPQMHVYMSRAASWDRPAADNLPAFDKMPPGRS
ncbi:MAG: aldehyde-activating protein [Alphaproteobacteria bacterium]|nr:aldehyde-activating protein [Alphaproteobacteria bacterium]